MLRPDAGWTPAPQRPQATSEGDGPMLAEAEAGTSRSDDSDTGELLERGTAFEGPVSNTRAGRRLANVGNRRVDRVQISKRSFSGASSRSLTAIRNETASRPSTTRWS